MRWSILVILLFGIVQIKAEQCDRTPDEQTASDRTAGTNGFHIEIKNNPMNGSEPQPEGYVPGEFYTIILKGWKTQYTVQTFRGFSLVAETQNGENVGRFKTGNNPEVRRSSSCSDAVVQNSLQPKTEVQVVWRAPKENVGCVEFKAMVLEYRNTWYMDEGALTKRFCQIIGYEKMVPQDGAEECCACDEAKYELVFDGLWSRQTHPKDFPSLEHLTHFSDLIGASHSPHFTMWQMGMYATDGIKELAEWGNTYKEEQELKEHAKEIRTIIKARGLWFPHVQGITKSNFRVDKYHHLMSLASMLGPSPDWVVGISKINLCLPDCTWVNERTFDLFPWDAGTDSGATYMAPNNPTLPREPIKPITTKEPADPRSPFYDSHSDEMPPVARVALKRKMIYPMECKTDMEYQEIGENATTSEDEEYKDRRECMVGSWTPWSLCSATCGKGIRMRSRVYKFAVKAQMFNCDRQMTEKQFCNARISVCEDSEAFNDECSVTSWSEWTDCSVTCENGIRTRTRNYNNPAGKDKCAISLADTEECVGIGGNDCSVTVNPLCRTTFWSDWSPCSASCGDGMTVRTRLYFYPENRDRCSENLMQENKCNVQSCERFFSFHSEEICQESMEKGQCGGIFPRYHFNSSTKTCNRFIYTGCKGNRNQFETEEQCLEVCVPGYAEQHKPIENPIQPHYGAFVLPSQAPKVHIQATVFRPKGSPPGGFWDVSNRPAEQYTYITNDVNAFADKFKSQLKNLTASKGPLPSKETQQKMAVALNVHSLKPFLDLETGQICVPANHLASALGVDQEQTNDGGERVDCMVTEWSPWSECSRTCGKGRRQRTRSIKVLPRNGGRACPPNMSQKRSCQSRPCPMRDCRVTPWTSWSACTTTCGEGVQLRGRRILRPRRHPADGPMCGWPTSDKRICRGPACRHRYYQQ